ncbi:MAG: hypothetical protein NC417_07115 [Candidatus Gastranaerophilales bacterium]|nr:hypothetical protein [Candidatus Gastranaerophilales bacterium]
MKKVLCYIKAIPLYLRTGVWSPHMYEEISREQGIIISTDHGFRISDILAHKDNEKVHPKAVIIKNKCVYCGHKDISWYDREPFIIK